MYQAQNSSAVASELLELRQQLLVQAGALLLLLKQRRQTLAVAESCTGGLLAEVLTEWPGSSQVFMGGVVAYSNAAKTALLGVPAELIVQEGAVSAAVVQSMACGARRVFACDYTLALSGVAGPGGGTPHSPLGLVWCGRALGPGREDLASQGFFYSDEYGSCSGTEDFKEFRLLSPARSAVRLRAGLAALEFLRLGISGS